MNDPQFLAPPSCRRGSKAVPRRSGELLAEADLEDIAVPIHHSAEEILAHPRFPFAREAYVKAVLATYEHNPFLSRLLLETGRTVLVTVIMCLYARYNEADPTTWPTLRMVTEGMGAHGHASASRVHDLLTQFVRAGYVERRAVPQDRRIRLLMPTAKMIAQDRDFLVSHYLPLDILFPEPGYAPIMTRDGAFQLKQRQVSRDLFALGAHVLASNPIMMLFMSRDAGVMILIKMIQMAGRQCGAGQIEFSYSDMGERFGVSRTHVRKLLTEAEDMELVRLTKADGRFVELTPELVQAFDRFLADAMSGLDLCYQLALR
jgi:hypothetical protein